MSKDLERRVSAIEEEMVLLRREAAAARALAAGADRDIADLTGLVRGNTSVLNALRETQVEHGEAVAELRTGVAELRAGMGRVETGMARIVGLLEGLVGRED